MWLWIIWHCFSNDFNQIGLNRAATSARRNRAAASVQATANFSGGGCKFLGTSYDEYHINVEFTRA
jgi:hypothetical protein